MPPHLAIRPLETNPYNGRMTPFLVLTCMVASLGGVIFGYDIGISAGVMATKEASLKDMFPWLHMRMEKSSSSYCRSSSQWMSGYTASLYVAGAMGALVAAWVTREFGRRPTMVAGGAASLAGSILAAAGPTVWTLLLGRVLLGFGVGFANQAIPLYLSEMAPPASRGAINNVFQLSYDIGLFLADLIIFSVQRSRDSWGWRISLGMAAAPSFSLTLGALFIPETANSIIQRDIDFHRAVKTLQTIRGTTDILAELNDIMTAGDAQVTTNQSFYRITRCKYRPQLIMAITIPFFQQVIGFNLVAFYIPILIQNIGFGKNSFLMSALVIGLTGTTSTMVLMTIVDRIGRRAMFTIGGIQMLVSLVAVGRVMMTQLSEDNEISRGYAYLALFLVCVYLMGFGWSWGPLGWLVPSEIFPLEIRSAGQSIVVAVWFLSAFVVAETFPTLICQLKATSFFIFGGWVTMVIIFIHLFLPETRGIAMERMDQVWKKHWLWKKTIAVEETQDDCFDDVT
uniref:Hexose carrier protein HEX6 isoform X2 n=1 Tax=Elaeis guineensis var. tenera TaxID=51953 RepID=A0A6J0PHQ6_ELAGV|nr:hexose carrier protein HEX6 isoform X2 [Elaeis guineensis]